MMGLNKVLIKRFCYINSVTYFLEGSHIRIWLRKVLKTKFIPVKKKNTMARVSCKYIIAVYR